MMGCAWIKQQPKLIKNYIFSESEGRIVASSDGVRCSNDGTASLQGRHNTSFADGDALLLHGFMDTGTIRISHLQGGWALVAGEWEERK